MRSFEEQYRKKRMSAEQLLGLIRSRDYIFSAQAAAEPAAILSKLHLLRGTGVHDVVLHTCLPVQDYPVFHDKQLQGVLTHNSWFFNRGLRRAHAERLVSDVPQHTTSAPRKAMFRAQAEGRRLVLIAAASPMDSHGYLSLSVSAIYERDVVNAGAMVLLEVDPNFPRTFGDTMIHISEVTALVESDRQVPELTPAAFTDTDAVIGGYIAELVEDGATIQLGIGNIPNAVAAALRDRRHLGIHSEMFTEGMVDLIECGAVDNSRKGFNNGRSVCAFTMGTRRLYDFVHDNPSVLFRSSTYTNDPHTIGRNDRFVSINATLGVDLMGQCTSEAVANEQISGTGGQAENVQGSQLSRGGKSVIAMHSTYTDHDGRLCSKIVPLLPRGSIVSTSRNDVDYVVTEYGVAWLRGLSIGRRVQALTSIAHPDFRDWLRREAERSGIW